jgi:hypothetical protein
MSRWRIPHGQYVRGTPDWFVWNRMAGSNAQIAVPAAYSFVLLYNDAGDGSMLHVIGAVAQTTTATNHVSAFFHQGAIGTNFPNTTVRTVPNMGQLNGALYTGSMGAFVPDVALWDFGQPGNDVPWPYEWPICILPPGYGLLFLGNIVNANVFVYAHWLVMGKNEGYF